MSAQREEPLSRVRMSWEDYLALPERPRAEWVDGQAVIMDAPPVFDHGSATSQLTVLLGSRLPELYVVSEVLLVLPRDRVRLPDLMMTDHRPEDGWVRDPPLLCVEVLSPSTRSEDAVRKSMEYAEGGVGQYCLVDPELRTLEAMRLVDGAWQVLAQLDDDHPTAEVELAGVTVPLDLTRILRR